MIRAATIAFLLALLTPTAPPPKPIPTSIQINVARVIFDDGTVRYYVVYSDDDGSFKAHECLSMPAVLLIVERRLMVDRL